MLPGYGWIFPLGNGEVNIGVGALATAKRPADVALRPLIRHYTDLKRDDWGFEGAPRAVASALLPMGGAVSGVAGPNWMLIGDAAACVNPLNGEGIDYGLETGRLAAELLDRADLSQVWPAVLQAHYGRGFSVARRLALLLTIPRFLPLTGPIAMRSSMLMGDRGAGDGQPGDRRRRRLDRAGLADGRSRVTAAGPPQTVRAERILRAEQGDFHQPAHAGPRLLGVVVLHQSAQVDDERETRVHDEPRLPGGQFRAHRDQQPHPRLDRRALECGAGSADRRPAG